MQQLNLYVGVHTLVALYMYLFLIILLIRWLSPLSLTPITSFSHPLPLLTISHLTWIPQLHLHQISPTPDFVLPHFWCQIKTFNGMSKLIKSTSQSRPWPNFIHLGLPLPPPPCGNACPPYDLQTPNLNTHQHFTPNTQSTSYTPNRVWIKKRNTEDFSEQRCSQHQL